MQKEDVQVQETSSPHREKQEQKMPATAEAIRTEMMEAVRDIAGPRQMNDTIQAMITKAARAAGMSYGRTKKFWYGEISVVPAHEADHLRAMLIKAKRARCERLALQLEIEKAKNLEALSLSDDSFARGPRVSGPWG
jgi:hypothetical protein